MSDPVLRYELDGSVALLHFDDGKANALSHAAIDELSKAFDRAESEAHALVLIGRPERLSAGFDLSVMRTGPEAVRELVTAGAEMLLRLYMSPIPTVVACSGHALAAGAILLLSSDVRIGIEGEFKIGLNEVGIGMALPIFAFELARDRLSKRHFLAATNRGQLYDPASARDVGYLDEVVAPDRLLPAALEEAKRLSELSAGAYRETKLAIRRRVHDLVRTTLDEDLAKISGPTDA